MFVFCCSHLSLPGFCKPCYVFMIKTQIHGVNSARTKQSGTLRTREARPRLVFLKLKACLFVRLHIQERGRECECCTQGRGVPNKCCDFPSQGITETLLSVSLHQETSSRKGRRIRLAGEKERVTFLILTGFSEVHPKRGECSGELGSGGEGA